MASPLSAFGPLGNNDLGAPTAPLDRMQQLAW